MQYLLLLEFYWLRIFHNSTEPFTAATAHGTLVITKPGTFALFNHPSTCSRVAFTINETIYINTSLAWTLRWLVSNLTVVAEFIQWFVSIFCRSLPCTCKCCEEWIIRITNCIANIILLYCAFLIVICLMIFKIMLKSLQDERNI